MSVITRIRWWLNRRWVKRNRVLYTYAPNPNPRAVVHRRWRVPQ